MPELYGQPYKWELREEISRLRRENKKEWKARVTAESRLEWAQCKIVELEAKIEGMQQQAQAIVTMAAQDVTEATLARREATRRAEHDAAYAAAFGTPATESSH